MTRFGGYAAIVTGGARGIGAAIARRLATEGARVVVADVDADAAKAAAADIGRGAEWVHCDVRDSADVDEAVAHTVETFGRLDVVVNNAYAGATVGPVETISDADWLATFEVTLHGAVRVSRAALPHLARAGGRGAIVNIGSVNGETGLGEHAYSAAKAGLAGFTRTLAIEAADHGVRVNLVAPGTIRTRAWDGREQTLAAVAANVYPLGRVGEPSDVAAAVAFLASADAAWITGVTLPVDGGLLAGNLAWTRAPRD
ncbi:putative oxidoreductase [Streptomyces sp. RB5]|uniref:Putative oxidoreductase n=1 Tax=Streptomyces smaragdinus TaxID=2585196 RepID=A0A7K0CP47_9ACTN|nr:SDR family NAD(P)-dependent oxidoreductase [Streptomyces smaragdinus]MQY15258.1 putative oxidoreductase [Streptomyces smaragdinus]